MSGEDDIDDEGDDEFYDDGRDLGAGQCNHESDTKAIFRFRSEDLPLSHSSVHHKVFFFYQKSCQIYQ